MARGNKKKGSGETANRSNTLLSFFRRSDDKLPREGRVKVEQEDGQGRGKVGGVYGNAGDPVVISDDEDEPYFPTKIVSSPRPPAKSPRGQIGRSPSPIMDDEYPTNAEAGPSRAPARIFPPPDRKISFEETDRSLFPNLPGFQSPASWPTIVNTADAGQEDDLYFDEDRDGSVITVSDEEDDGEIHEPTPAHSNAGTRNETEKTDELPGGDEDMTDDVDIMDTVQPLAMVESARASGRSAVTSVTPQNHPEDDFDPGLVWDEPEDEGMGMEEEGDEDASDIIATPPPVNLKRKRGAGGSKGESVICPVCGVSLKGKTDTTATEHINTCLDTPSSSRLNRTNRPISSFANSFSPAGSPSPPPEEPVKGPNAFSVLMSGHKEKEQWKDAEVDLKRDGKRHFGRRKAPFYKVMTGMPVAVDAFRYGAIPKVTAYLLTHAHSDHYTNLSKSWKEGPIYCSETTANLIIHMLGVEPQWVHGLPDNIPFEMPNTGGVTVTPIEANHCPGSSIFLFEGPQTVNAGDSPIRSPYVRSKRIFRYLHCGDFRACPKMILHPAIARAKIDTCYLDTTYLNPKYCFPPQPQVIEACALLARKTALGISDSAPPIGDTKTDVKVDVRFDAKPDINAIKEEDEERSKMMMQGWLTKREEDDMKLDVKPEIGEDGEVKMEPADEAMREVKEKPKGRTLVVMGTYSIGKERIVKAVAKALGTTIYCDPRKRGILLCQTDPDLHALMSDDPVQSQVHLLPLGNIQLDRLQPYLARLHPHFDRVLGFRPTGWAYTPPAGTDMLPDVNMVIRRDQARTFSHASLKPMRGSCRQFMMYGVPYSEHSSFFELTCFALSVPGPDVKMIATVNVGNEKSRAKMKKWFEKWAAEKAKRREKNLALMVDYRDETYW